MMNNFDETQINASHTERVLSITEAARLNNVTRQAIYVAIKQKKLKARKEDTPTGGGQEPLPNLSIHNVTLLSPIL